MENGDIIDGKDKFNYGKWYEGLIKCVGSKEFNREGQIAIHYIGQKKWDEWLNIRCSMDRLAPREHIPKVHTLDGGFD